MVPVHLPDRQLGTQSSELDHLFESATNIWNIGGGINLPILTFGRISSNVKASEAAQREAAAKLCAGCPAGISGSARRADPSRIVPCMW